MGREAKALIMATALPTVEAGVEVLRIEGRLLHAADSAATAAEEESWQAVLVMFDPLEADRWSVRAMAASYIAAKPVFEQAPRQQDWMAWLTDNLDTQLRASSCILVFGLPDEYSAEVEQQITRFLQRIRTAGYHHLQLAVAVAIDPFAWLNLSVVDGFVAAASGDRGNVAMRVFNLVTSLVTPGMATCLDAYDLLPAFGSAQKPSQILEAVWLLDDDTLAISNVEGNLLAASQIVAVMPSRPCPQITLNRLTQAIKTTAKSDPEIVLIAPFGLTALPSTSSRLVTIQLLCKPN